VVLGALLFLLLFVWAVYSPAKDFSLLNWDDDINLQANPHLTGLSWVNLKWMFTDLTYQWRYQPLAWVTWFSIYELQGLNPFGYHLINILLHLANTVLVFLVVRKVFARTNLSSAQVDFGGFVAAALWSLHPMRVELVAWAVELLYNQALFFLLLSYWAYLNRTEVETSGRSRRWFWLSLVCLTLSLFTFPLALGFLGVLLVTDIYILHRVPESPRAWLDRAYRAVWLEKLPFVLVTGLAVALNLWSRASATGLFAKPVSLAEFGVFPRVMQACYIWSYYLWRPFWPVDLTPVPTQLIDFNPLSLPFLASAGAVIGVTILTFYFRRRNPWLWCVWLIHLVVLLPMLGLTEHPHFPSDRYGTIVGIGVAALLAAWCARWWKEARPRGLVSASAAALAVLLAILSTRQLPIWTNNTSFFDHLLVSLKDQPFRFNILTRLAVDHRKTGSLRKAESYAAQALEMNPQASLQRLWLGDWQMLQGKKEQARQTYITGLVIQPDSREFHARLAHIYASEGRFTEAAKEFAAELQVSPRELSLDFRYFLALAQSGNLIQAQQEYDRLQKVYGLSREENIVSQVAVADGYAANGDYKTAIGIVSSVGSDAEKRGDKRVMAEALSRLKRWRQAVAVGNSPETTPSGPN